MRRLLLLVCAIVLVDASFYAAITPLLPFYADQEGLSKTGAGILVGSYPAGTLLGSLPAGALAVRFGARAILVVGLALLAVSSVTFGLADSIVVLDGARFAQGIGGALSWTGGLGWLSGAAPAERRGQTLATAMAAATAGTLLGPVLGAIARGVGPEGTFSVVGLVAAVLLVLVLVQPGRNPHEAPGSGSLRAALTHSTIARGAWFTACTAFCFGIINVLLPLRMDSVGASGALIAVVWLVSSGLETLVNPWIGRYTDRHGWQRPARWGLIAGSCIVLLASLPHDVALLAAIGIASGPLIGVLWTPGLVLLSLGSDEAGFDHTYAFAIMNLAWASAQTVATAGGGALAHATRDLVPYALVAVITLTTAALMTRTRTPVREA
jgi:MFS family permease